MYPVEIVVHTWETDTMVFTSSSPSRFLFTVFIYFFKPFRLRSVDLVN